MSSFVIEFYHTNNNKQESNRFLTLLISFRKFEPILQNLVNFLSLISFYIFDSSSNHGLQHSVAILEKLYTDVNFPKMKRRDPKLKASPYELGISRADLWAFAGLVALDQFQSTTKELCRKKPFETMCGDNSTSCFAPFPENSKKIFKTGRIDCRPRSNATIYHKG